MKKKWRFNHFRNMKFFQRMILVYIIGGIIPLLVVSIYTNSQIRKMMLNLTRETQSEEISLMGSSIRESMTVLNNVARLLCLSDEVEKMAVHNYSEKTEFFKDYYGMSAITEYLNFYQQDISYINIYIKNDSVKPSDLKKINNFSYLSESVKGKKWYKQAVQMESAGYWFYGTIPDNALEEEDFDQNGSFQESQEQNNYGQYAKQYSGEKTIQIARAMRDKDTGDVLAVVVVSMQFNKTVQAINDRGVDSAILFNDKEVITANYDTEQKYRFLIDSLADMSESSFSDRLVHGVEEYLLTYERIKTDSPNSYYSLVSIQNYQDMLSDVNRISLQSFIPEFIGMVISALLIVVFAITYSNRMHLMRVQMHRVAQGEYELVEPLEGNDEIGELYQELEQMMKDIQLLMNHVVEEQVQKEKLHTRQKEVEFKMLASQINPHFLYNTLETIRMKAMVNKQPEIVELVMMLAKTMRYNIQVSDRLVTLKDELQMVEYYLKIQEYRFGDRIRSELKVDETVDDSALIMPLTIQPFVENAFVHGLEEKDSGGYLSVSVHMEKDIQIEVCDNGVGMDYYQLGQLRKIMREDVGDQEHIGVRNVNQRIHLLYGSQYGIHVESELRKGTKVIITIPYQKSIS